MLLRIILLIILGYLVYRFIKRVLSPPSPVKGQRRNSEKKKYDANIEDAEYEDLDT